MEPTDMATFNPQSLEKSAPANCGDGTGHRGWRIGWSPSLVPSSARVTSALSWTKCAPTLSTSRTGSLRLVTQWLRGKKRHPHWNSSKKMADRDCTLLLIVTWDIRFDEHNHWVFKIHEQDKLYQNTHDCLFYPWDWFCSTTTRSQWSSWARYINSLPCMTRMSILNLLIASPISYSISPF